MKTTPDNAADTFGTLGPKVQPQPKPVEQWLPTETPGIERNQDGRVRTNLPLRGSQS